MSGVSHVEARARLGATDLAAVLGIDLQDLQQYVALKRQGGVIPEPVVPSPPPECLRTPPMVSGVLVLNQPSRLRLARHAVDAFLAQTWPSKQLVIINGTQAGLVAGSQHPQVVEHAVVPGLSIGQMRNIGLDIGAGDWFVQWDDDDHSHPERIARQMLLRHDGLPVLLRYQVRCDCRYGAAFVHDDPAGISGTLLHPRTTARYPSLSRGEDTAFWVHTWGKQRLVIENDGPFPSYSLSIAFAHGLNATPRETFLGVYADSSYEGKWSLPYEDVEYLRLLLPRYGLRVSRLES